MSPLILYTLSLILGFIVFKVYKYHRPYWVLPGPPIWYVLKLAIREEKTVNEAIYKLFRELASKYRKEGLTVFYLFFQPLVIVHDLDSLQTIFKDPSTYVKGYPYRLMRPWLGRSALTTNGAEWKERRRLLIPGFHASVLRGFISIIQRRANDLVDDLKAHNVFDALPVFTNYALGNLCENMMGYKLTEDQLDIEYCQAVQEATRLYVARLFNVFDVSSDFIFYHRASGKAWKNLVELMRSFCAKVICERKKVLQTVDLNENGFDRKFQPVLDSLLKAQMNNNSITDEMLNDEANGLIFAGHDSTALTLTMAVYVISKHPTVWLKIKDEICSILGSSKERDWTFEDTSKMVYLEAVIKEVIRYSGPLEVVRTNRKEVKLNGHTIPQGTNIICTISGLFCDPKHFPEPDKFKPERFLDECGQSIVDLSAFIPFLLSPRQCIGQHYGMIVIKMTLAELARHFSMRTLSENPKFGFCIANKPMTPLMIEMTPDHI